MGKLTPALLPESLALAQVINSSSPLICSYYFKCSFSQLFDLGVQFGFWSGSQLIRGQDAMSLAAFLCYHCCLVEVTGLEFSLLIGSCPLVPDFLFHASFSMDS